MQLYSDTIAVLNHLLGRSRDAQKMYVEVSNNISDPDFSKWLLDHTTQRAKFEVELENQISCMGGEPVGGGTIKGALHRVWIDLKSYWTNNNIYTLLEELERGEVRSFEDYEYILRYHRMPRMTRIVLKAHRNKIKKALKNIKTLKRMYAAMEV